MPSEPSAATVRRRSPACIALLVALAMNLANLFEPLTVDDVCHQYYAAQAAHHPGAPLEFVVPWHQKPVPAWTVMVPPVFSYFWAPGIRLGELAPTEWRPVVWHAWFLPTQWLFCYGLLCLLRRWVRRHATALLVAVALGPTVLPGINLMIEVPMLALGVAGLALLQRAFDRRSALGAAAAGLVWGLALQTKYSAAGFAPAWFLLALAQRRWREFAIGCAFAAATALAIEGLLSLSHGGGSYFMTRFGNMQVRSMTSLAKGMFQNVGMLGVPAALLALVGLRAGRGRIAGAIAVYVVGHALIALCPEPDRGLGDGALDAVGAVAIATVTWAALAALFWRLARSALAGDARRWPRGARALRLFLVAWFVGEIVMSFGLSPFPAARRVVMVVVAATVAAGWLAVRRRGSGSAVRAIAAAAALLGCGYQAIDQVEGHAWVDAARGAVAWARARDPAAKVCFVGGWGFEFYAPRAGMAPFLRGETALAAGDFVACGSIDGQEVPWFADDPRLEQVAVLPFGTDGMPLSTQFAYYSGERPLARQQGPRYVVRVLRATQALHARELAHRFNPYEDVR